MNDALCRSSRFRPESSDNLALSVLRDDEVVQNPHYGWRTDIRSCLQECAWSALDWHFDESVGHALEYPEWSFGHARRKAGILYTQQLDYRIARVGTRRWWGGQRRDSRVDLLLSGVGVASCVP